MKVNLLPQNDRLTADDIRFLTDSLNRGLRRALRQVQLRSTESFRCKEPLSQVLINALDWLIDDICDKDALETLLQFSRVVHEWIETKRGVLDEYFGESALSPQANRVNKPQPHFAETVLATLIRYELIIRQARNLLTLDIGCILGGSMSYGRFFNVRQPIGRQEGQIESDIDLLLIVDFDKIRTQLNFLKRAYEEVLEVATENKGQGITLIPKTETSILYGLVPLFLAGDQALRELDIGNTNTFFSKKFLLNLDFSVGRVFHPDVDRFPFLLSAHICSKETFKILTAPVEFEQYDEKSAPRIVDVRFDSPPPPVMVHSTMDAIPYTFPVELIGGGSSDVEFGAVTATRSVYEAPAYWYWEKRFVSGVYQNLMLPAFHVITDMQDKAITRGVDSFKTFLKMESLREREEFRDSALSISNLSPRHPIFLSDVAEQCDMLAEKGATQQSQAILASYTVAQNLSSRKSFHAKYPGGLNLESEVIAEIRNHFGETAKSKNVLELGCGDGRFLSGLYDMGYRGRLVGVDVVPSFVPESEGVEVLAGVDINELEDHLSGVPRNSFDIIVALHVLYHINDVSGVLEQALKFLKPDGVLICTTNSNQNLPHLSAIFRRALIANRIGNFSERRYRTFSSESAPDSLREFFRVVKHSVYESDIVVTDKADILQYIQSSFDNYDIGDSLNEHERILNWLETRLGQEDSESFSDRKIVSLSVGRDPISI